MCPLLEAAIKVHFVFVIAGLLLVVIVHAAMLSNRSAAKVAELGLLYLLVGYCGIPMFAVSVWALVYPQGAAMALGFANGPLLSFFAWAYLGMSIIALLSLRYRGTYLVAPVAVWAVYLGGATQVHFQGTSQAHGPMHASPLEVFAAHGFVALLLLVALAVSGAWRPTVTR
jgi:hypothetical protein